MSTTEPTATAEAPRTYEATYHDPHRNGEDLGTFTVADINELCDEITAKLPTYVVNVHTSGQRLEATEDVRIVVHTTEYDDGNYNWLHEEDSFSLCTDMETDHGGSPERWAIEAVGIRLGDSETGAGMDEATWPTINVERVHDDA